MSQLLLGHLKAEDHYDGAFLNGALLCDVQRESSLSHGRTGCDNDQIGPLKSVELVVQISESCRRTKDFALILSSFVDFLDIGEEYRLYVAVVTFLISLRYAENALFSIVQDLMSVHIGSVSLICDVL